MHSASLRNPTRIVAIAIAAAIGSGCASSRSQAQIKFLETREMHRPYHEAYDAAINAMFSLGFAITHTDKQSGVISAQIGDYAQQFGVRPGRRSKHPVKKITLLLRPAARDYTRLRMKVLVNEKQQLDRKLMTQLWQRIEREAMLDDDPPTTRRAQNRPQ